MKEGQRLWTRDELILAINLYCKLPFGKMHVRNPSIKELAAIIHRTPGAVARKLGNFASFDPDLKARGIKGLPNAGGITESVWNEFHNNWDTALIESEKLLAKEQKIDVDTLIDEPLSKIYKEGISKERLVNIRLNQYVFRKMVLGIYENTCCMTGIQNSELLVASHIVPWSEDEKNRLNPANGLCLNALHDRAFDKYLITVSADDYTIRISSRFKIKGVVESIGANFARIEGQSISLPDKALPNKAFLKKHNDLFVY